MVLRSNVLCLFAYMCVCVSLLVFVFLSFVFSLSAPRSDCCLCECLYTHTFTFNGHTETITLKRESRKKNCYKNRFYHVPQVVHNNLVHFDQPNRVDVYFCCCCCFKQIKASNHFFMFSLVFGIFIFSLPFLSKNIYRD